ncbi:MAG: ComF family protein [bacterium]
MSCRVIHVLRWLARSGYGTAVAMDALLLPPLCPLCQRTGSLDEEGLCADCRSRLPDLPVPRCPRCGGTMGGVLGVCGECLATTDRPWTLAVSVFPFQAAARELVHRFKYQDQPWLARFLGGRLAVNWLRHGGNVLPDAVVPVPLHPWREFRRGYNQAELLARELARALDRPVRPWLRRRRWTRQQARLDPAARQRNVRGVFRAARLPETRPTLLLVDDVFTTGATLAAAARELLKAGAGSVMVATIARD